MADRPILFRDDMVRAILDGRKTVTRRVGKTWAKVQPGDVLWVRETHMFVDLDGWDGPRAHCTNEVQWPYPWSMDEGGGEVGVWYRADALDPNCTYHPCLLGDTDEDGNETEPRWRPSIHMPRWACRLTLRVVSVCVERVDYDFPCNGVPGAPRDPDGEARREGFGSWDEFWAVWQSMHADHIGPVWRVEFERVE